MQEIGSDTEGDQSVAVLKTALEIEEFGIQFYSSLAKCVTDRKGAALLRSLGNDEKEHKVIVEKEIARLAQTRDVTWVQPLREYLRILPERVFTPPPDSCLTLSDEMRALETGIEVEENSIRMYSESLSKVQEAGVKRTLETLANWEGTHKKLLEENLRLLKLEGSWYGYGPILEG